MDFTTLVADKFLCKKCEVWNGSLEYDTLEYFGSNFEKVLFEDEIGLPLTLTEQTMATFVPMVSGTVRLKVRIQNPGGYRIYVYEDDVAIKNTNNDNVDIDIKATHTYKVTIKDTISPANGTFVKVWLWGRILDTAKFLFAVSDI